MNAINKTILHFFSNASYNTPLSFDTFLKTKILRTSGSEPVVISKNNAFLSPLALSVLRSLGRSRMYRRVTLFLFITSLCNATDQITFKAIENYLKKPLPHSYVDYQSFEALSKHANGLFTAEQYEEAIAFYKQALALNPTCAQIFFQSWANTVSCKKIS